MRKVRASQVVIETPSEGAEPWILVKVQLIEKINGVVNTVDRYDSFNMRLSAVAAEIFPAPESLQAHDPSVISVLDVAASISTVVVGWLAKRYNGTIDESGNVILEY